MTTNTRGNLTKKAYELISSKIINLDFKPGEKISEKMIENNLGIGRTPIREALLKLKQEHLINVVPQSGTYVSKIDLHMVRESCFVRVGIEKRIMREAALISFNEQEIQRINEIIKEQVTAVSNHDFISFFKYNDDFHRYFYQMTGHLVIWSWLRQINMPFQRFRLLQLKLKDLTCEEVLHDHRSILKAIIAHDIDVVEKLASNESQFRDERIKALATAYPEYFVNISE